MTKLEKLCLNPDVNCGKDECEYKGEPHLHETLCHPFDQYETNGTLHVIESDPEVTIEQLKVLRDWLNDMLSEASEAV